MDTFTVIHDQNIQGWVCEEIMEDFFTLPMVDIIDEGGNSFIERGMRDKNHRYEAKDESMQMYIPVHYL